MSCCMVKQKQPLLFLIFYKTENRAGPVTGSLPTTPQLCHFEHFRHSCKASLLPSFCSEYLSAAIFNEHCGTVCTGLGIRDILGCTSSRHPPNGCAGCLYNLHLIWHTHSNWPGPRLAGDRVGIQIQVFTLQTCAVSTVALKELKLLVNSSGKTEWEGGQWPQGVFWPQSPPLKTGCASKASNKVKGVSGKGFL